MATPNLLSWPIVLVHEHRRDGSGKSRCLAGSHHMNILIKTSTFSSSAEDMPRLCSGGC